MVSDVFHEHYHDIPSGICQTVCELENGPVEIVDLPIKKWWFSIVMLVYQSPMPCWWLEILNLENLGTVDSNIHQIARNDVRKHRIWGFQTYYKYLYTLHTYTIYIYTYIIYIYQSRFLFGQPVSGTKNCQNMGIFLWMIPTGPMITQSIQPLVGDFSGSCLWLLKSLDP